MSPRPIFPQPDDPGSASTRDEPSSSLDRPRPTLPRVVVPTFPERNRPQGQQKRNADADPPSPRHRMTKRLRKGITAKEKLHWLKLQDSQPDLSNRALAKLAKVQPCQIRDWKKMRERLEVSSSCRRRLMGAGRKSKFPFMERADWITQVMVPFLKPLRESTGRRKEALVVLDSYRGHLTEAVGQTMRMFRLSRAVIPGGCTPLVQPLDVSINRAFKCGVRHCYSGWFEEEGINTTTKSVLDDVNDLVDDELVVNPFYVEVPMPAEELQAAAEEADAAEEDAEAAAAEEEGGVLEEGGEAEEPSDDEWWRPGRFDGEDCEEWHAGDDSE
ncbi:unnamed protein product [Closterium sp. NIES-65]|nr:unnamed protein product [Closterium sp. NIES-65]